MANTTSARAPGSPDPIETAATGSANERDMAELRAELNRLSRMVSDMAQNRYSNLREQAQGVAQDWTERGMQMRDDAMAKASAWEDELQRSVRDRPITAVAIAAGVGYLIGLLSRSHD